MRIRFPVAHIQRHAHAYTYPRKEDELMSLRPVVQITGHMTKEQLRLLAEWKSPRSAGRVDRNSEEYVQEVTTFALECKSERGRIEVLTLLDGVLWPTASVVLHLFHPERYPILDFRALWSVGTEVPTQYTFSFWERYVKYCRALAEQANVSMRALDRALWQYSKDNQPRGGA